MDRNQFDALAKLLATSGSRRLTLGALLGISLFGEFPDVLAKRGKGSNGKGKRHQRGHGDKEAQGEGRPGAKHKAHHQRKHTSRQRRKKRNRRNRNQGGKGGVGGPGPCTANGGACQQNRDCCGGNCFNQVCADPVTACDGAACPTGATGCCTGTCCASPTNQCNALGECCVPNCGGKTCGPDGCGNTGICGTCSGDLTCDENSGKCLCTAENCPDGCCSNGPGNPGTCESGETFQQCGTGGAHCAHCANTQTCQSQQCVACAQGSCTCSGQSACLTPEAPNAYCTTDESCYCAVTTAGVPVCASGATTVRGGCQTDQDCVDAFAGAYCLDPANNVDPQNPCFFGQSFCGGACNP